MTDWNALADRFETLAKNYMIPDPRYRFTSEPVTAVAAFTAEQCQMFAALAEFCRGMGELLTPKDVQPQDVQPQPVRWSGFPQMEICQFGHEKNLLFSVPLADKPPGKW